MSAIVTRVVIGMSRLTLVDRGSALDLTAPSVSNAFSAAATARAVSLPPLASSRFRWSRWPQRLVVLADGLFNVHITEH